MRLAAIDARPLAIPFRTAFRHAAAVRSATRSVWVRVRSESGIEGFGEGCPREYVTGETIAGALAFLEERRDEWVDSIRDLASLRAWIATHCEAIDRHPAAFAAVELALLDAIGREGGLAVEALLGTPAPAGSFRYTAVIGDAAPAAFAARLERYVRAGFRRFKVKLVGDPVRDRAKVDALTGARIAPGAVRADANNCWTRAEDAIDALRRLDFAFAAVEEPACAGDIAGMRRIADALDTPIILDESVTRLEQMAALGGDANRWIVNVRVSKMGGLLRSLAVVDAARRLGLRLVVGAHVGETSVLARAGLTVAASAREQLFAQEGAFGTYLLATDVADPPLMFGDDGVLDADVAGIGHAAGLGLMIRDTMKIDEASGTLRSCHFSDVRP